MEADPTGQVDFKVVNGQSGTKMNHCAEIIFNQEIATIKEDLASVFGVPANQQEWRLGEKKLEDKMTLRKYDIEINDHSPPKITVTKVPPPPDTK